MVVICMVYGKSCRSYIFRSSWIANSLDAFMKVEIKNTLVCRCARFGNIAKLISDFIKSYRIFQHYSEIPPIIYCQLASVFSPVVSHPTLNVSGLSSFLVPVLHFLSPAAVIQKAGNFSLLSGYA